MVRDRRSRRAKSVDKGLLAEKVYPNTVEGRSKWRLDKSGCDLEVLIRRMRLMICWMRISILKASLTLPWILRVT